MADIPEDITSSLSTKPDNVGGIVEAENTLNVTQETTSKTPEVDSGHQEETDKINVENGPSDEEVSDVAEEVIQAGTDTAVETFDPYGKSLYDDQRELGLSVPIPDEVTTIEREIEEETGKFIGDIDKIVGGNVGEVADNDTKESAGADSRADENKLKDEEQPEENINAIVKYNDIQNEGAENIPKGENFESTEDPEVIDAEWWGFVDDSNFSPDVEEFVRNAGLGDIIENLTPEQQQIFQEMYHKILDTLPPEERAKVQGARSVINNAATKQEIDRGEEFNKLMVRLAVKLSVKFAVTVLKNIQKSADKDDKVTQITCGTLADLLEAGGKEFDKAYTGKVKPEDLTIALRNHFFGEAS